MFIFLAKLFETYIMGANDDLDGKTTHLYWLLHTHNKGTTKIGLKKVEMNSLIFKSYENQL